MKENKSLFRLIANLPEEINGNDVNDHLMMIIEMDANGIPKGNIAKVKGRPFAVLGMIDMMQEKLKDLRESILEKFDRAEAASQSLQDLPQEIMKKIEEFEQRARDAVGNNDLDAVEKIKEEANEYLSKMLLGKSQSDDDDADDNDLSDGFNINDFKGSF